MSIKNFYIVDSTLREGGQCKKVLLSYEEKKRIARELDKFGIEYIELGSPRISDLSYKECKDIANMGLKSKILTHVRCSIEDVKIALDTGVDGINIFFGVSSYLQEYSHGKGIDEIIEDALKVIDYARNESPNIELRFSCEDVFRSSRKDILKIYKGLEKQGKIDRFGIADTVGIAMPKDIKEIIKELRTFTNRDIEFHGHNDTGCAIINSYTALEAGATHIDTTLLGVGERNGITSLSGIIARLYNGNEELLKKKYKLKNLKKLCELFSELSGVKIPMNHYIVGDSAFTHKAGVHTKAVLSNPKTYECIIPEDFGITRKILIAHEMVGWNTIKYRAEEINLDISDDKIKSITKQIKEIASVRKITLDEIDRMLIDANEYR